MTDNKKNNNLGLRWDKLSQGWDQLLAKPVLLLLRGNLMKTSSSPYIMVIQSISRKFLNFVLITQEIFFFIHFKLNFVSS